MQLGSEKCWMCFSCEGFRASWSLSWKQNLEYIGHIIPFGDGLKTLKETHKFGWWTSIYTSYCHYVPITFYHIPSGWWFGTFMTFPSYWECHHPNRLISPSFFRGVETQPPTSHYTPWSSDQICLVYHRFPPALDDLPILLMIRPPSFDDPLVFHITWRWKTAIFP